MLRESCPLFSSGVKVQLDSTIGVVWVHAAASAVTFAFCYFSPASSRAYSSSELCLDEEYWSLFVDGLNAAKSQGRQLICMGDFNIRTGSMCYDATGPAIKLGPNCQPALGDPLVGVPVYRQSQDLSVPDRDLALSFLLGLHSAEVALLNGRIAGDSTGNFTYHQHSSAVGGTSVVDYAAVSASLFANVRDFRVLPFDSVLSADHCALQFRSVLATGSATHSQA